MSERLSIDSAQLRLAELDLACLSLTSDEVQEQEDSAMAVGGRGERRKQPRVGYAGQAIVSVNADWAVGYRVENISAGGAMLVGGPHLRPGRRVRVLLRLEGLPPIGLDARVLRGTDVDKPELAVEFTDLDPGIEDLIQDVVLSTLSGRHLRPLPMDYSMKWEPLASESHAEVQLS